MSYHRTRLGERGRSTEWRKGKKTTRPGGATRTYAPGAAMYAPITVSFEEAQPKPTKHPHLSGLGADLPTGFPTFPGFLPGPPQRFEGAPMPQMPTSIFPTHTRIGDVVTISGPFGTFAQGQVRVKFTGTGWLSPQMLGPATASVVVPPGAQNGVCEVEINGRRVFGTQCIIDPGTVKAGRHGGPYGSPRAWRHGRALSGLGDEGPSVFTVGGVVFGAFALYVLVSMATDKR